MKRIVYILLTVWSLQIAYVFSANAQSETGFKVRAFHLDFRTQVMTSTAIKELANDLANKGINTLILEYEASFPFTQNATLSNEYAFTKDEIKDIVSHCQSIGIDVIPLQNCFGHCEYILKHERYASIREDRKEVSQVCPLRIKEAKTIFRSIFKEVAELHPSPYFHIGADETYLLGSCSKCSKVNKSKLFVDYVKAMCELVREMGKTPVIWADIILKHPEAAHELPKDIIFVDWNYGWKPNYFGKLDNLFKLGVKIWGAPSLRSAPDNIYLTQWMKHFQNLRDFLPFARENGYEGIIETSWSTSGTYGFHYDSNWEVTEMQPIRQVYPMNGFQILIDAFCQAAQSTDSIRPEDFICNYANQHYGLSKEESTVFLSYFQMPQEMIKNGKDSKGVSIPELLKACILLQNSFYQLSPKKNQNEFEHYKLMLDLRINYLKGKELEHKFESDTYDIFQAPILLQELKSILLEANKLDKRFIKYTKGYLKSGQAEEINAERNKKLHHLLKVLEAQYQSQQKHY